MVNVIKFQTLITCQKGLSNSADTDQTAIEESSLIKVFPVYYLDQHFVSVCPEN